MEITDSFSSSTSTERTLVDKDSSSDADDDNAKIPFVLDWAGRGTSHVDFAQSDPPPLVRGRFLGRGVNGDVYETSLRSDSSPISGSGGTIAVAWKTIYGRRQIGQEQRNEIEILKKLSHGHVIKLVGTYTFGKWLGLLLWPVAECDLASFLEDVDMIQERVGRRKGKDSTEYDDSGEDAMESGGFDVEAAMQRFRALGFDVNAPLNQLLPDLVDRTRQSFGCVAKAIEYLHSQRIRHKDLKPANVLMSSNGALWITDFGKSTDFSEASESATCNGDRGTPKYFAPEVAAFEKNGRSADIFSLGCIFLEMLAVCTGHCSLEDLKDLRPRGDRSFQANLNQRTEWFKIVNPEDEASLALLNEINWMITPETKPRPTARTVVEDIALIERKLNMDDSEAAFHGSCCWERIGAGEIDEMDVDEKNASTVLEVSLAIGNEHRTVSTPDRSRPNNIHQWSFFVRPSHDHIIQRVDVELVRHLLRTALGLAYTHHLQSILPSAKTH